VPRFRNGKFSTELFGGYLGSYGDGGKCRIDPQGDGDNGGVMWSKSIQVIGIGTMQEA